MSTRVWGDDKVRKCCLCQLPFRGLGNNPDPLGQTDEDRCCDVCNDTRVIPARLAQIFGVRGK